MKNSKYIIVSIVLVLTMMTFNNSFRKKSVGDPIDLQKIIDNLPSPYTQFVNQYDAFVRAEIDTTSNVGAAVAIVCNNSVVLMNPYGIREAGTTDSVDIHTVFRLASVSKGFAGVLVAKLEQEKLIDLNDKVKYYLPGLDLKDSINENDLTIRHTLNHTSGLVPHAYDNLVEAQISMDEIIGRLNEVDITAAPGVVYGYQNALFSLIDTILRVKTNSTYSELLVNNLFTPLGMKDASADYETMANTENLALPHVYYSKGAKALKPNKRYYNMVPAAGVNASISDMAIWLQALLGNQPEVIDSSIQRVIATPTIHTPLKRRYYWRWKGIEDKHYSLGWRIYTYRGYDIVYHGGFVKGYRAEVSFCPELNAGIVFLQNSPNRLSSESVPKFWDMYFESFLADSTRN